ncbi:hypothetical protein ACO0LL_19345 [Undibacterium sp. TC4M20W]|uniref:hypothetical protein n=1 Tax=Undibacterium sp. TC4M20W TaxID=3413052 RepID=UPI003BF307F0
MQAQDLEFIMKSIRQYLQMRPDSADTVEGIARFWIDWQGEPLQISMVSQALENMRNAGELESRNVGGRTIWHARR